LDKQAQKEFLYGAADDDGEDWNYYS
jgi:hypothetical protein